MLKLISITGLLLLFTGMLLAGCTQPSAPAPTDAAMATFGQYSQQGQGVFASRCASCHGGNGQGAVAPALWGASANLAKYKNAGALLDFVSSTMPGNAPGSLSREDYIYVVSYLLGQNNYVSGDTRFEESKLGSVSF